MKFERICRVSGEPFRLSEAEVEFYRRNQLSAPELSPLERQRRRIAFRNFRTLHHRRCSGTGEKMISMYDEHVPFPVYTPRHWWSDAWDAKSYGRAADQTRPFFEAYAELSKVVPRSALMQVSCENSDYCNMALDSANCYLVFGCVRNRDCLYGHIVWDCESCLDCLYAYRSQWCSNGIDIVDCYDLHYSIECTGCSESSFLFNCRSCRNCFGCFDLQQREYCFFNEQLSKQEYEDRITALSPLTRATVKAQLERLLAARSRQSIHPPMFGLKNEDVSGNHIYESKGIHKSYDVKRCEDSMYLWTTYGVHNSCDISFTGGSTEHSYNSLTLQNAQEVLCSHFIFDSANVAYSEFCYGCHDIFGCSGLRKSEYCILNKQYSREDYFSLRTKLVEAMREREEWGEFFPANHAPFAYNESIAQEYQPLTQEQALKMGYAWRDKNGLSRSGQAESPPDLPEESADDLTSKTFSCSITGKAFQLTGAELEISRRMRIPLPSICPEVRHIQRMNIRGPRALFLRQCLNCRAEIIAAHSSEHAEQVFCIDCYEQR